VQASTPQTLGVVIVDHGSRRSESNAQLEEFAAVYAAVSGRALVEVAHMEIAAPSIMDALARAVARGATHVVVAPYFLSNGRHIQTDIPALVAEGRAAFPHVRVETADPIGARLCLRRT